MGSFLRKGKRKEGSKKRKEVKQHTKEFYKILGELDRVADVLKSDEEAMKTLTAENLKETVEKLTDVEIGKLELFVLKGKLGMYASLEKDIEDAKKD